MASAIPLIKSSHATGSWQHGLIAYGAGFVNASDRRSRMTSKARSGYRAPKVDCETAYPADVRFRRADHVIGTNPKP